MTRSGGAPGPTGAPEGWPVEATLRAAARGDAAAWRSLVGAYHRRVYGLLVRQCGDRELAEELTQATFVKLVEKLGTDVGYEERGRFEPWLFRVAMNGLRDEMRRRKRQAVGTGWGGDSGEDDPTPASLGGAGSGEAWEALSRAEEVERVRRAVEELGEADREVLHLRHTAGLSFAEIAETLGQPLGTVLARAHRAVGKLRKRLETGEAGERAKPQSASRKAGER